MVSTPSHTGDLTSFVPSPKLTLLSWTRVWARASMQAVPARHDAVRVLPAQVYRGGHSSHPRSNVAPVSTGIPCTLPPR